MEVMNMESIVEPKREIPVLRKVDVVIAGAGPAGFAAAVAAARNGAKTLLVEQANFVGGLLASGLRPAGGFINSRGEQVVFGVAQELVERLKKLGACSGSPTFYVDSEIVKIVAQQMCEEAGVNILFHSLAVTPVMEGNRIKGIFVENKSGRQAILAKVVIDATGDGDIAARTGAPFKIRDREHVQPANMLFRMNNVKKPRYPRLPIGELLKEARKKGEIPSDVPDIEWGGYLLTARKGEVAFNLVMVRNFHATDALELSSAEEKARRWLPIFINLIKKYWHGFKNAHLIASHNVIGVRETRQIIGDYVLTAEDVIQGKRFKDGIAMYVSGPNLGHHPKGKLWTPESLKELGYKDHGYEFGDIFLRSKKPERGGEVPYRCLLPRGIEGILVAGRCISATPEAMNPIRLMAQCMATGQASGTAAAMAVKDGVTPREVDALRLRKTLKNQGLYFIEE